MNSISIGELPYLDHVPSDGRSVILFPFRTSHGKDQLYLEQGTRLLVINPLGHHEGPFIAEGPRESGLDIPLPLSDCTARHFSFPPVIAACNSAETDIRNSLAVLHKYFILLKHSHSDKSTRSSVMAVTEAEYAFSNHRSLYDRLNEVVRQLWRLLRLFSPSNAPSRLSEMPDSFRRVAQKSEGELRDKYNFPEPLIAFYKSRLDRFMVLREIRDAITHHGKSVDHIFSLEDGFAISVERGITSSLGSLGIWSSETLKPNSLGSLLAVFAALVDDGFCACQALADALLAGIHLPSSMLKTGHRVFYRSQLGPHYHTVTKYQRQPWQNPDGVLAAFAALEPKPKSSPLSRNGAGPASAEP
jgi:hypothetical protein